MALPTPADDGIRKCPPTRRGGRRLWSAEGGRQEAAGPGLSCPQPVAKPLETTFHPVRRPRAVSLAAALLVLSGSTAFGQSLIATSANVLAADGDSLPGLAGGETIGGTSSLDSAVIDASGVVLFRARMVGGSATATTDRVYLSGTTRSNLQILARSGDAEVSGTLPGVTMRTATLPGLSSAPRLSEDGRRLFGTSLFGTGVTTSNDSALYMQAGSGYAIWMREGDAVPGTVGATISSTFSSASYQSTGVNENGVGWFMADLIGGDVVGSTNNRGLYVGTPGALSLVLRKGDLAPNGATIGNLYQSFVGQMNNADQVFFDVTYLVGSGSPAVTTSDDRSIWLYTPSGGAVEIVREGDPVTGLPGVFYNTTGAFISAFSFSANCFNSSGAFFGRTELLGAVNTGVDNNALVIFTATSDTIVIRAGDPVPGSPTESIFNFSDVTHHFNDAGQVCFAASIVGAPTTSDSALFTGTPGNLQMIAREGDFDPNTGWSFGSFTGNSTIMNNAGQIVFNNTMQTGGAPATAPTLWAWDPSTGLQLVGKGGGITGDNLEVRPSVFKQISTFGGVQFNNGASRPLSLDDSGRITARLSMIDNSGCVLTVDINSTPTPVNYCTAGTTTNTCNATMAASGSPSIAATSGFTLSASNVESDKQGLIFYSVSGRASTVWAAGRTSFQCVKAPTQRTGAQSAGGTPGACDRALSVDWLAFLAANPTAEGAPFSAGTTVNAQAWFRDPPAPKTTNLSDGLEFVTLP